MAGLDDIEDKVSALFGLPTTAEENNSGPEDTTGSDDQGNDTEQSTTESTSATQAEGGTDGAATKPGSTTDTTGKQPEQGTAEKPRPTANPQDIVDPRTGEVIAAAGKERRWYDESRNAKREVGEVRQKLQLVETELSAFKQAAILPQQLGLQPAEVSSAMQFMAHFKANPVEAARKVLAEVQAAGYTIPELGGTDVAAIKQIVEQSLKPFVTDREQSVQQETISREVEEEYNNLAAKSPWIVAQDEDLTKIMAKDTSLDLRQAALLLENFALRGGYDLNRSVEAQYFERQQQPAQVQPTLPAPRVNRAAAPAQTSATSTTSNVVPRNTAVTSNHSTRDIIREAMREQGINVDNL
jgi:hypothetical protein